MIYNRGIINTGSGSVSADRAIIGSDYVVARDEALHQPSAATKRRTDVGVITILPVEMRAVLTMLSRNTAVTEHIDERGAWFYEAAIEAGDGVNVVATRALDRGQRSALIAFDRLVHAYAPGVVVLVGIAGGMSSAVKLNDVVVATQAIYYEARKETPSQVRRRTQTYEVPARIRHAINSFFNVHGEPCTLILKGQDGKERACSIQTGPIGSGEAVVAYKGSDIRRHLENFNDKTLALETEVGGIAHAFYEEVHSQQDTFGWFTIRGISDYADEDKNDGYHESSAWHAALVLERLLPYLKLATPRKREDR
ncbi:phosphorylase family protein [Microbispora rosea]|uniref:5'-methylthioadenosine/S-adenosylhomocysteine nucleosidase family protein n=1 Tax=Microbispora rosea TaxID=58117 RepID=UPI0034310B56